jgi:hypothetical protein
MTERRREPRNLVELAVRIWGIDGTGSPFRLNVLARDYSTSGALLAGIECKLRSGDPITIQYRDQHARFRVVWVRDSRAAVQKIAGQSCPWSEALSAARVSSDHGIRG